MRVPIPKTVFAKVSMKVKCSIEAEPRVTIACHEVRVRLSKVTNYACPSYH